MSILDHLLGKELLASNALTSKGAFVLPPWRRVTCAGSTSTLSLVTYEISFAQAQIKTVVVHSCEEYTPLQPTTPIPQPILRQATQTPKTSSSVRATDLTHAWTANGVCDTSLVDISHGHQRAAKKQMHLTKIIFCCLVPSFTQRFLPGSFVCNPPGVFVELHEHHSIHTQSAHPHSAKYLPPMCSPLPLTSYMSSFLLVSICLVLAMIMLFTYLNGVCRLYKSGFILKLFYGWGHNTAGKQCVKTSSIWHNDSLSLGPQILHIGHARRNVSTTTESRTLNGMAARLRSNALSRSVVTMTTLPLTLYTSRTLPCIPGNCCR